MKKITIFALHLDYGGIEKYTSTLCKTLEDNYDVEIICTFKVRDQPAFDFSNKIKISYLIKKTEKDISIKKLIKNFKILSVINELVKRLIIEYKKYNLNKNIILSLNSDYVISTRLFHSKLIAKYLKNKTIKTIMTDHNHHQDNKKYINDIISCASWFNTFIICTKDLFNSYKPMLPNTNCVYIPNAVDSFSNNKTKFGNKNIIFVGRLSPEKGIFDLLEVFKHVVAVDGSIKLFLLGDGYLKEKITNEIKNSVLENNVIMPGFVSVEDQEKYYLNSDLFVMASFTEAFGLVLIEAMNYGVPCVAFDSASGPRELINKNIGVLVSNRNKIKMAKEIIDLLEDKDRLMQLQKNIEKYMLKFSLDENKKSWLKTIEDLK